MDEFGVINYLVEEQVEEDPTVGVKDNLYHSHVDILKNYELMKQSNKTKNKITKYEVTKIIGIFDQNVYNTLFYPFFQNFYGAEK